MSPFFGNLWWLWGVLMRGVGQIYYGGGFGRGLTAAGHGRWTNIHGETLALSCETKKVHGGKSRHMDEYSR